MDVSGSSPFLSVLSGKAVWPPPLWMMRQAGRYLPEYREVRAKAGGFLDLCFNPALAAEVTLQPIRRFGFDAAILFSDILVVPHALGQKVWFAEGEGPRLDMPDQGLETLCRPIDLGALAPVFEALAKVKASLSPETAMIGFCGAPWTVASYMVAGKSTPDQAPARLLAYQNPDLMNRLIETLVEASIEYLIAQVDAGADAVQIFESFGGALSPALLERLSLSPIQRIVEQVRAARPHVKVIVFLRGGGAVLPEFSKRGVAHGLGIDWNLDLHQILPLLSASVATQGNLDPLALVAGGPVLKQAVSSLLDAARERPHIVNLGHGIVPQTPIEHVEEFVTLVRRAA